MALFAESIRVRGMLELSRMPIDTIDVVFHDHAISWNLFVGRNSVHSLVSSSPSTRRLRFNIQPFTVCKVHGSLFITPRSWSGAVSFCSSASRLVSRGSVA